MCNLAGSDPPPIPAIKFDGAGRLSVVAIVTGEKGLDDGFPGCGERHMNKEVHEDIYLAIFRNLPSKSLHNFFFFHISFLCLI